MKYHDFFRVTHGQKEKMGLIQALPAQKQGSWLYPGLSGDQIQGVLVDLCPLVHMSWEDGNSQHPRGPLKPSCVRKGLR